MAELKIFLTMNNDPAGVAKYYKKLFGAKLLKKNDSHHKISIYENTFYLNKGNEAPGTQIMKFNSMDEFNVEVSRVKKHNVDIEYEPSTFGWETILFRFKDKYGATWVFEANTNEK